MLSLLAAAFAWQSRAVAGRHLRVHLRNWYTSALPPILEPIIMLLAFGLGLGSQMSHLNWRGQDIDYLHFLAPGIIAYTAFMTAFFQSLFGAYIRMHYQRIWEGQLITQIRLPHVIWGELLWAALLSAAYCVLVVIVLAGFAIAGLLTWHWPLLPLLLPAIFLTSLAFASLGLLFTAIVPNIDHMNIPFFVVIMPLAFTSNTFFPIAGESFPAMLWLAINPLHHLAEGSRLLLLDGQISQHLVVGPLLCLLMIVILVPINLRRLRRRVLGEG